MDPAEIFVEWGAVENLLVNLACMGDVAAVGKPNRGEFVTRQRGVGFQLHQ